MGDKDCIKRGKMQTITMNKSWPKILREINRSIASLYKHGKVNREKLKQLGLENEAVNWGDLHCYYADVRGNKVIAYVEEVAPDANRFKNWLEEELKKKGYDVEVVTEW